MLLYATTNADGVHLSQQVVLQLMWSVFDIIDVRLRLNVQC